MIDFRNTNVKAMILVAGQINIRLNELKLQKSLKTSVNNVVR